MEVADRCRLEIDRVRDRLESTRAQVAADAAAGAAAELAARKHRDTGSQWGHNGPGVPRDRLPGTSRSPRPPERAAPDGTGSPGGTPSVASRGSAAERDSAPSRPGLEALRLAVHQPHAVAARLDERLFVDDLHRRAFQVLAESEDLHEAIEASAPDVADLLRRVTVEEPFVPDGALGDPVDAVIAQLLREAARRELMLLQARARTNPLARSRLVRHRQREAMARRPGRSGDMPRILGPVASVAQRQRAGGSMTGRTPHPRLQGSKACRPPGGTLANTIACSVRRPSPLAEAVYPAELADLLAVGRRRGQLTQGELVEALHARRADARCPRVAALHRAR